MWALTNVAGVSCVWAGAMGLFRYGLPFEALSGDGYVPLTGKYPDAKRLARAGRLKVYGWVSVAAITLGSVMQIVVSLATL